MRWLLRGAVLTLLGGAVAASSSASSPTSPTRSPAPAAPGISLAARAPASATTAPSVAEPARRHPVTRNTTANWAGRVVTAAAGQPPLGEAAMRLTVPAVVCPGGPASGETSMMSVWTGIGGWHGDVLYQAGLEVTCAAGNPTPAYDAFYEGVRPGTKPIVDVVAHTVLTPLATHPIAAGDLLTVRVTRSGDAAGSSVRFSVADLARAEGPGWALRWEQAVPVSVPASSPASGSAECVVERPSITDTTTGAVTLAPLPRFSAVFAGPDDGCTVTDATGRSGLLGDDFAPWAETVVAMTGSGGAGSPVGIAEDPAGNPMAVTWRRSA